MGKIGRPKGRKNDIARMSLNDGKPIEKYAGEIVGGEDRGALPDNIMDLVTGCINDYCVRFGCDDMLTAPSQRWTACCMYVGMTLFKKSDILHDRERERVTGGTVYDAEKVSALVDVWSMLCNDFGKPPLMPDFCNFAGISWSWLNNNNGNNGTLTSADGRVYKKLQNVQELGISSRLVDGRGSQVGQIFFLKNWHGWKDQREIVHTDGKNSDTAAALPMFDDVPALPGENT